MLQLQKLPMLGVGALVVVALASSCSASSTAGDDAKGVKGAEAQSSQARSSAARGGAAHTGVRLVKIGNFDAPVFATGAPGQGTRLFVVEKAGRIAIVSNGHKLAAPFLDISQKVGSTGEEQGLLSMAFAPDYASSGLFYVYYTDHAGDIHVDQLRRSATNPDVADPGSARSVLSIEHHLYPNHNGGQLQFGPDGYLYLGVGDGGSEGDPLGNGQNTDVLLGKLLRIAPKPGGGYAIPAGNPFVGQAGKRAEIWAYGLRNPWRFSFDRKTGSLIVGRRRAGPAGGGRFRARAEEAPAPTTAGACSRAIGATGPARLPTPSSRCSSPATATATARSSAATWCATPRWGTSMAVTSTATSVTPKYRLSP